MGGRQHGKHCRPVLRLLRCAPAYALVCPLPPTGAFCIPSPHPPPPSLTPCSLHQVHDEEKGFEMELAWVCEESGRQFQRVPQPLAEEAGE